MPMSSHAAAENPYTRGLAAFVSGLRYEQIPGEVIQRIKLLILDAIGCAISGVDLQWSRILLKTLSELDATRTCGVWGTSSRLSHRMRPCSTARWFRGSNSMMFTAWASC